MKVNKIFCDICKGEIEIEIDEGMGMFERIRTETKISLQANLFPGKSIQPEMNKELVKSSFDLCKKCAAETEEFLNKKKEEFAKVEKVN